MKYTTLWLALAALAPSACADEQPKRLHNMSDCEPADGAACCAASEEGCDGDGDGDGDGEGDGGQGHERDDDASVDASAKDARPAEPGDATNEPSPRDDAGDAGSHEAGQPDGGGPISTPSGEFVFPAVSPFSATGPFAAISEPGSSACTIYRPATLGEDDRRHPVIVWGNGTFNSPTNYDAFFKQLASQGFIVAAANTSNSGSGKEMIQCLDWILAQDAAAGAYQNKIDAAHLMSSGYSQGGCGCLMAGRDERFVATAPVFPYIALALGGCNSTAIKQQSAPMFMISGGADTVAGSAANQEPIFKGVATPVVWGTLAPAGHNEIMGAGGALAAPLTAWFRYKLMNDPSAAAYFKKSSPGLALLSGWTVKFNAAWTD